MTDKLLIGRAVVQQALEFIRTMNQQGWMLADYEDDMERTVAGLEVALAQEQPEHDPALSAALGWPGGISDPVLDRGTLLKQVADLRTAPPQRPPLTDKDMLDIIDDAMEGGSLLDLVRAVERKVRGEKE